MWACFGSDKKQIQVTADIRDKVLARDGGS